MPRSPRKKLKEEKAKTIVGRAANPLHKENWEDDFELPNSFHLNDGILSPLPGAGTKKAQEELPFERKSINIQGDMEYADEDPFANISDFEEKAKSDEIMVESKLDFDEDDDSDWDKEALAGEKGDTPENLKDVVGDDGPDDAKGPGGFADFEGFANDSGDEDWTLDGPGFEGNDSFEPIDIGDDALDGLDEDDVSQFSLVKKLFSHDNTGRYNIVTYPEAPELYSIAKEHRVTRQDEQLVSYLRSFAPKESEENKSKESEKPSGDQKRHVTPRNDVKSPRQPARETFNPEKLESLPVILSNCLHLVRTSLARDPVDNEHVPVIVEECSKYIQQHLSSPNVTLFKDHAPSADLMYSILHATASHQQLHPVHIRTAILCFPLYTPLFNLLKFECNAHHNGNVADLLLQSFCQIYATQKKITDESLKSRPLSYDDSKQGTVKKRDSSTRLDGTSNSPRGKKTEVIKAKVRIAFQAQARALASLHLYLDNRSPIDWKELSAQARYEPLDNPSFEWLLNAFEGKPPPENSDEQFKLTYTMCGNEYLRMITLQKLYDRIDPLECLAKAQAAFALAKYLSEGSIQDDSGFITEPNLNRSESGLQLGLQSSSRTAESIAYECVHVLEKLSKHDSKDCLNVLRSQMGVSALVLFGEILNANSKYQYAVHAFESAIGIYKVVTNRWYYEMINTLSTLCEKHGDWKRALKYHLRILEKAKVEGNLNMYVYIVQQISKIHTKAGDFLNAVKHLRSAIEVLNQCIKEKQQGGLPRQHHTLRGTTNALDIHNRHLARLQGLNTSRKVDFFPGVHMQEVRNQKVNLYLRLAQHFLDAKRIIEAIVVLEFLLEKEGKLPRGKISVVHLLLATAYTKKRLYGCARDLIDYMQQIAQEKKNAPSFNIPGGENVCFNAEFTPILGVSPSEVVKTREFVALCAKTAYSLGRFSNAGLWTRISMRMSESNPASLTLGQRGNLHYRMGKILQGIIFQDLVKVNLGNYSKDELTRFPDTRECMKEFDQAYTYFDKVSDQVHIAKVFARIVETYLHVAFTAVGMLGQSHHTLEAWLDSAGFRPEQSDGTRNSADEIWDTFLKKIERPALHSLDVSLSMFHPILYLKCLINVAEIRFLQGKYESAVKFWRECKNTFFAVAMNSERCVMVDRATPGMTSNITSVFERLVRLLMCFHPDMINLNLVLLDSFNLHTIELFADVEQSSQFRSWPGAERRHEKETAESSGKGRQTGLRQQRMLHMRGVRGIRDDVDIFMNNDTEVMLETRKWLRQRKTPEPLTQEKHWRKHLSAFMGAVGSRSMSKSLHHDLAGSMMYDNYLDRDSYKKAIELRDTVCSLFYQISLNFSQATAGRFSQKEMTERNRSDLHSIISHMDQLRNLTYYKSGRSGGLASIFSPSERTSKPNCSRFPSRRASSVWMSEFSNVNNNNSKNSDPLWQNLSYCVPLGCALIMYSPQLKTKLVKLVTAGDSMSGPPGVVNVDPKFLAKAFDEFIALQNKHRKSGRRSPLPGSRQALFRKREKEILRAGKSLGMFKEARPGDYSRSISVDHQSDLKILCEEEPPMTLKTPDAKGNGEETPPKLAHRRLPSSQFMADVDETNDQPDTKDSKGEPGDEEGEGGENSRSGRNRRERVGSLYDVFAELQGVSSNMPSNERNPSQGSQASTLEEAKLAQETDRQASNTVEFGTLNTIKLGTIDETTRKRSSSEGCLSKLQLQVSFSALPGKMLNPSERMTLEVYNGSERLCLAKSVDSSKWGVISFMINRTDLKQMLWFVVRKYARGSQKSSYVGQQHVALERLVNVKSKFQVDLEDQSSYHSQPNLDEKSKVGSLVFNNVNLGNEIHARSDSLEQILTFPDKKRDSDTIQEIMDKLIPQTFDIMLIKELLAALDRQNILALLSAMFNECQIILTSQNNFRLKAAINCLLRLMYPFQWQHTLVPLLPRSCVGMLQMNQPYIIAVNQFVFPSCIDLIPPKAIVAFLDHNQIRIRPGSFIAFPRDIKNRLSTAILQFRGMLFRSLVTHKDFKKEAANRLKKSGSHDGIKSNKGKNDSGTHSGGKQYEVKVTGPPEEQKGESSSQNSSMRASARMMESVAARPEVSLQILKRHFLDCFVSLFYKFRLYWTDNPSQPLNVRGFLKSTKAEFRPFIHNFVRTKTFNTFIELRASITIDEHSPNYVFDEMVYQKIWEKHLKIKQLQAASKSGKMLCQKGKGRWKMRSVEVVKNKLNVYKYNKRKGAKYTRILRPGFFQIEVPVAQLQHNYYSFELRNVWESSKDDSTLTFRVNSDQERQDWVKAMQVRIMDMALRAKYVFIASKFGHRFMNKGTSANLLLRGTDKKQTTTHHKRASTTGMW